MSKLYRKREEAVDVLEKEFVFIIGSPKSGTTWLQIMLGEHPCICTTVELTLYDRYLQPMLAVWKQEANILERKGWSRGLPFLLTKDEFQTLLRSFVREIYRKVNARKPRATHILDKNPNYSLHTDDISWLLPNARFIHIIRDGRDVVGSMLAARRDIGYGAQNAFQAAVEWKRHVTAARVPAKDQGHYLEVRYEDLLQNGFNTLKTVFSFCGVNASDDEIAGIYDEHKFEKLQQICKHADERAKTHPNYYRKGVSGSWRDDLTPMQCYLVDVIAASLLSELGYAEPGWWAESRLQKLWVPLFGSLALMRARLRV